MFSQKLQKNIDRLIRDLYLKPKTYQAFKKNPEEVGLRYGVSKEAIEAIKTNDWKKLLEMGMNPKLLEDPAYRITDKIRLRFLRFAASALVIVFGMLVSFLTFPGRTRAKRVAIELPKRTRLELPRELGIRARLARRVTRKLGNLGKGLRLTREKRNIFARMKRTESVLNRRPFDHIGNFNFKVEIDGVSQGAFKNIKFLDPIEEYKDGDDISIIFGKGNDVNVEEIFRNVEGLDSETEVIEYQDGDDIILRKRPGRTKYSNIVLKRGYVNTDELWRWRKKVIEGRIERKNGSIILYADDGSEIMRDYNFFEAWPAKQKGFTLDGKGNDVNVEGIEIAVEKIERSAKAAKNEQFRHNIVMSLIQKMPDGRF